MTRVLVVGGGAREHTLAWKLAQSSAVDDVVCAPGNVGMEEVGECVPVDPLDPAAVAKLATELNADLTVVGPEDPLAKGVVDAVEAEGRLAFGPSKAAARLEGSKAWLKDVLQAAGVPTARHGAFTDEEPAFAFLDTLPGLYVVKTDGLAAGKGVIVTESLTEARDAVRDYLAGRAFGDAGRTCVIEEGMTGPELSVFVLCDGNDAMPFAEAQDHKRAFDGDQGGNTGGMGAYTPVPWVPATLVDEVMAKAVHPTLAEMRARDAAFRGLLYCGLMLTPEGPKIVEYNVRFGDPEAQVMVPRLASDLYAHCRESAEGRIETPVRMHDDAFVCIALASEGYPPAPTRRGDVIEGIDQAQQVPGALVFHYATKLVDGALTTNGGRVLTVVGTGPDVRTARDTAYQAAACISWTGLHYRRDIAAQALT